MNIIICGIYSRAVFISFDMALWGSVYSRVMLNRVNKVLFLTICTVIFVLIIV